MSYGYGQEKMERQLQPKEQKYKKMHVVFSGERIVGCCHSERDAETLRACLGGDGVRVEPANFITFHTYHDKDGDE